MNMHHIITKETINLLYPQRIFSGLSDNPLTQKRGYMSQLTIHSTFPQDSWYLLFTRHFTRQLVPIVHSTFPQDSWYLLFTRHFTRQLVPIVHSTFPQDSWYLLFTRHFQKTAGTYCSLDISQDSWYLLFTRHFHKTAGTYCSLDISQDSWYLLFTRHFHKTAGTWSRRSGWVGVSRTMLLSSCWLLSRTKLVATCGTARHSTMSCENSGASPHTRHTMPWSVFPGEISYLGEVGKNVQGMSATLVIPY